MLLKEALVIFPHQLFDAHPAFFVSRPIVLIEEWLFFRQYHFHQQKLVLHRASMKYWQAKMEKEGFTIYYIETTNEAKGDVRTWLAEAAQHGLSNLHVIDPVDDWLTKRVKSTTAKLGIQLSWYHTHGFLNKLADIEDFFAKKNHYHQTDFYIAQRKKRNLLLEPDGKPMGGKWTFDADNRERFPKNGMVPSLPWPNQTEIVNEAIAYVQQHFADNYGMASKFRYPVTHAESIAWLDDFLENRFAKFGIYEDAMVADESVLFHSVLTPMLNIGLLVPNQIIEAALNKASQREIPLNALEGFIRQIVGWREFIRLVYELEGTKQRTTNYWKFNRKIPKAFWTGETGIGPMDKIIKKVLATGYNHHIERLMVAGNFLLLCEFDPNEVYRWFMEMYIDAYDWVMVPNVYGMTQFADGGLMTTKPYISGSNYLLKMGDWPKGDWQVTWDGLFWRFMHVHRAFFLKNPRLGMLVKTFDKMSSEKQQSHLNAANAFLQQLDEWNEKDKK